LTEKEAQNIMENPTLYFDSLRGQELQNYIHFFLHSDMFKLDTQKKEIYQQINPIATAFSEIGTLVLNYILNCDRKETP